MEEKTPKELLQQAYNDLSPEDRELLEKIKKENKELLERLKDDGPFI